MSFPHSMPPEKTAKPRRTQSDRRATTRRALLDAAARALAREGYANLVLERVASEAGYTRGALYHQFADKDELTLAAVSRADRTWRREVGLVAVAEAHPVDALIVLARAHAVYCRRDVARLLMTLRVEFHGRDHPVGQAVEAIRDAGVGFIASLIVAAREAGEIPQGLKPNILALAYFGSVEGLIIQLAGEAPYDEQLAEQVALGLLGVSERASA
jgi:AcrR family transcriptional regulator